MEDGLEEHESSPEETPIRFSDFLSWSISLLPRRQFSIEVGSKYVLGMGATTRVYGDFPIQSRKYIGNVSHIDIQMVFTAHLQYFLCRILLFAEGGSIDNKYCRDENDDDDGDDGDEDRWRFKCLSLALKPHFCERMRL